MQTRALNFVLINVMLIGMCLCDLLPEPLTQFQWDFLKATWKYKTDDASAANKNNNKVISEQDLNATLLFVISTRDRLKDFEKQLIRSHIYNHTADNSLAEHQNQAYLLTEASIYLKNQHCRKWRLNAEACNDLLQSHVFKPCQNKAPRHCSEALKYRQLDGGCNNLNDLQIGSALTGYKRYMHAEYQDGVHTIKRSMNKRYQLPSPTVLAQLLAESNYTHNLSAMDLRWADFVRDDLIKTAARTMLHSPVLGIVCCDGDDKLSPRYIHPFCAPIYPTSQDRYGRGGVRCLSYVRSMNAMDADCKFGYNQQMNGATHYLDASHIYGTSTQEANQLRTKTGGRLIVAKEDTQNDLVATFKREHNRIAKQLERNNPYLDDEQLYQEARRIIIAEIQHITYNEWLPKIIGDKNMEYMNKFSSNYHPGVDASISNSFATAVLFNNPKDDLIIDIQRGRDHGLGGYTKYREICGLPEVNAFNDLTDAIDQSVVKKLSTIYKHHSDVDLIVGGLLERSHDGALFGPTFTCLITDQFMRTRSGDRLFYTFSTFTNRQVRELSSKVTLAQIMCTDNNQQLIGNCNSSEQHKKLDLKLWKF